MKKKYSIVLFMIFSVVFSSSCQTVTKTNKIQLSEQLHQYLGKNSAYIRQHLDLSALQIQIKANPISTSERMIFSFDRMATIVIPLGSQIRDSSGVFIPAQTATVSNSYNHRVSCNIIFILAHDIAQSVSLLGQGC